jgi:hypothetical protein
MGSGKEEKKTSTAAPVVKNLSSKREHEPTNTNNE